MAKVKQEAQANWQRSSPANEEVETVETVETGSNPLEKVIKTVTNSPGWRVLTKFEAPASFFIPFEDGTGWNSTAGADGGGKVYIDVHKKHGEVDVKIVRWLNGFGKDGMNCRILHLMPLHRGEDRTEFFFKALSTTTFGVSRKTVFALKFNDMDDADYFEMYWLMLNDQLAEWKKLYPASTRNDESLDIDAVVSVRKDIKFFPPNIKVEADDYQGTRAKRKYKEMALKSPVAYDGKSFCFSSPDSKPPAQKKMKTERKFEAEDDEVADNSWQETVYIGENVKIGGESEGNKAKSEEKSKPPAMKQIQSKRKSKSSVTKKVESKKKSKSSASKKAESEEEQTVLMDAGDEFVMSQKNIFY